MVFTRAALEADGFRGWIPLLDVRGSDCPRSGGVYMVSYNYDKPDTFARRSCGGWFKGKDPTAPSEVLEANWVDGAEIVYIGKADQLRRRLSQFADFGAGKPVGHWGGRLIWQLPNTQAITVAWKETPENVPLVVEAELIAHFRANYGKPPLGSRHSRTIRKS